MTTEQQLENKANFIGRDNKLFLVRCMACPDAGERGIENYSMAVANGTCAWCGWSPPKPVQDEFKWEEDGDGKQG